MHGTGLGLSLVKAAEFLGKLDTSGTIERNKAADLVLLDANPLDGIHNTRRISAVIIRGQVQSASLVNQNASISSRE